MFMPHIPDTLTQVATTCQIMKRTMRSLFEQAAHIGLLPIHLGLGSIGSPKLNFITSYMLYNV